MATSLKQPGTITVEPLSPTVGAEIKGVDLSHELDPDTVRQIRAAWGSTACCCSAARTSARTTSSASPPISGPSPTG